MHVEWQPFAVGVVLTVVGALLVVGRRQVFGFITGQERNNFGASGLWLSKKEGNPTASLASE
jgi:hypothetical protein